MNQATDWYQLIITDPEGLSGVSVHRLIVPVIERARANAVIAADLEGAVQGLVGCAGRVLTINEFYERLTHADQYDWAFFFLFREQPAEDSVRVAGHDDHKDLLRQADATIRLADDTYLYVYSRDPILMGSLRSLYPSAAFKRCAFVALEIPY